jgi:hypothetical protein
MSSNISNDTSNGQRPIIVTNSSHSLPSTPIAATTLVGGTNDSQQSTSNLTSGAPSNSNELSSIYHLIQQLTVRVSTLEARLARYETTPTTPTDNTTGTPNSLLVWGHKRRRLIESLSVFFYVCMIGRVELCKFYHLYNGCKAGNRCKYSHESSNAFCDPTQVCV